MDPNSGAEVAKGEESGLPLSYLVTHFWVNRNCYLALEAYGTNSIVVQPPYAYATRKNAKSAYRLLFHVVVHKVSITKWRTLLY